MCILSCRATVGFTNLGQGLKWIKKSARAYKGVWGCTPSGMQEQRPWGSQWAKSPEAEDILAFRLAVSY